MGKKKRSAAPDAKAREKPAKGKKKAKTKIQKRKEMKK